MKKPKAIDMTSKMQLLPPPADTCQECAVKHAPELPHNQQSLFYQVKFNMEHKRFPTWHDAMAHCTPEMKAQWIKHLTEMGVKL